MTWKKIFARFLNVLQQKEDRILLSLIAVLVLARFVLAAFVTVSGDASAHLAAARFIAEHGDLPFLTPEIGKNPFWSPPLFHVVAAGLYRLGGEVLMKLTPAVFGSAAVYVVYALGRQINTRRTGLYAAAIYAVLPMPFYFSTISYLETATIFFTGAAILFYLRSLEQPSVKHLSLLAAALAAGLWTKYSGVIPFGIIFLHMLWQHRDRFLPVTGALITGAVFGAPWYLRNYLLLGNPIWHFLFGGRFVTPSSGTRILENTFTTDFVVSFFLQFWGVQGGRITYITRVLQRHDYLLSLVLAWVVVTLLLTALFVYSFRSRNPLFLVWVAAFLTVPFVFGYGRGVRYAAPIYPAIALAVTLFFQRQRVWKEKRGWMVAGTVFLGAAFLVQVALSGFFLNTVLAERNDVFYQEIEQRAGNGAVVYGVGEMGAYHTRKPTLDFRPASPLTRSFNHSISTYTPREIHAALHRLNVSIIALDNWSIQAGDAQKLQALERKIANSSLFEKTWEEPGGGDARIYRVKPR